MFVPTPPPTPSPEARELGGLIAQLVQDYRAEHPDLNPFQVQQALAVARRELRSESAASTRFAVVIAAALAMLGLVGFLAFTGGRQGGGPATPVIMAVGIVAVVMGLVAALVAARRR